ncbi:metallo-beta-lactamase superfamily protein [Aspergillus luchuensis]|uniref:Metallo-beta-lactamase superfamily protein n=1 Tax=Aspergillus kawachii TaxID=1069201 RepID=A0A146FIY3_ASPKA|nr:metallo-beta-lactamase superfamily protein [Aspergillus luchuensis]
MVRETFTEIRHCNREKGDSTEGEEKKAECQKHPMAKAYGKHYHWDPETVKPVFRAPFCRFNVLRLGLSVEQV